MSIVLERLAGEEVSLRQRRCLTQLASMMPDAAGLLVFSRVNHYYLTGSLAPDGVLWLPSDGEPLLLVRKGLERVRMESPLRHIVSFRSFSELPGLCAEAGVPLKGTVAVDMNGLSWTMGRMLQEKLPDVVLVDASGVFARVRAVKTPLELERMRQAGARHAAAYRALESVMRPGMSERDLTVAGWNAFIERGHAGFMRLSQLGGENVLGQAVVGDNGNFPICTDGTIGYVGGHTAVPFLGNAEAVWERNMILHYDLSFCYLGYYTDKTQIFWSGPAKGIPDPVRRAQDACLELETRLAGMLRPGTTPEQIWHAARDMAARAGYADCFMGFGPNKVQYVGHGIGLESEGFPVCADRFAEPLQEGMTLAVEPKINLAGLGVVGVENVFEVTPSGGRSITGTDWDIVCLDG